MKLAVISSIYKNDSLSKIKQSLQSLLNQENVTCDIYLYCDGPVSIDIVHFLDSFDQNSLYIFKQEQNRGLAHALNELLNIVLTKEYEYIARMDGDDRCSINRLEVEFNIFMHEPEIAIVSTDMQYFDETGVWGRISHPTYPRKRDFLNGTPFCHAP